MKQVILWTLASLLGSNCVLAMASGATGSGSFTAVVIGAGPAGLALSLGLCGLDSCERVHLVERQSTFDAKGANFFLAFNGLKALEEMSPGITDEFKKAGIEADMIPDYPSILLPWWEMRDVLLERVRKLTDKVTIYTGMDLNRIDNGDSGVSVQFSDKDFILEGDFLVGADGVHSAVRKQLNLPEGIELPMCAIRGHVNNAREFKELEPLFDRGFIPVSGNHGIDGVLAMVFNYDAKLPGKLAWSVGTKEPIVEGETSALSILDPSKSTLENKDDLNLIRAVVAHTEESNIHYFGQGRVMDFSQEYLDSHNGRWGGKGRVTLVGDAAHAFPAADGQGGSQAFEDALILTRLLHKKKDTETFESILQNFEKQRLPRVKKLHDDQTRKFEGAMNGVISEPWSQSFREWVFEGV